MLSAAASLPHQLTRLLPAAMPVSVTIINSTALGRMSIAVHLIPTLSRILIHADAALVLIGLATARRRRLLPGRRRSRRRASRTLTPELITGLVRGR